ncbi:bcl-2-associated transcription factor 1 isoform X7 [Marmota marmota marmota]|uniref:bcl-2-associated transcription factor 1 isoform X7 n=1 Tax=Marmota marmota marmota TaxID=9994 RepID=UPI002092A3DC|nr:bcl-2-associated transcription factor 1 isoform X7 [Marmota marmota marmota]
MGRSNSRSHSSRSKSRSQSSSRSRSRSHSRKKRYSSRSRSRTYSRSRSRDRIYSRDYRRDYRNNRGMRRPYGYRGRGRGYYQGGGGRYHRGGYRPVWNRRHSRSPRRGRSRSRSPKRRSVSSQRSRSRSRRSYRSSRSPRSSSSRSSSPYSKSPVSKRRGSQEKQTKKAEGEPQEESPLKSKSQEETKDTFEHDPSESIDEFNKSATSGDIWPGLSAYDNSPRSPHSPSPIATPPSQSSSCSDAPMLSTVHSAKNTPSQHSHSIQHSPERSGSGSVGNGSSRYSPSQNSPIHHIPSRRSPAKTVTPQNAPRDEARGRSSFYPDGGDQETAKTGKFLKSPPLHKNLDAREKSTFREESPLRIKMIASDSHRPEVKLKMAPVPLDDSNRPASLTKDRLLASTLVHSVKKEQEFRSIFDHIKLPQASKSTSESFIQHIVSLVHHVKEQYFKSAAVTLNERFTSYQKATEEHSTRQKSPEIHRRIDISPSALRKHTRLAGEERVFKEENQKGDKKLRCDSADLRHDIDRRRKERSKERGDSKGSRESSGSRKQEKTPKDYKEYKSYKDDSKHKSREQDHSRSSSSSASPSSPSSREEKESKKEREEEFKTHHEMKEYSGFAGVSRPRGTFHDDRDDGVDYWAKRGRGRGTFQRGRGRFNFKKSGSSPKWTHDKYQGDGIVEDEDESMENNEEKKERRKEEKE